MATTVFLLLTSLTFIVDAAKAADDGQILDPEVIRKLALPPLKSEYDAWTDWETWEASPEVTKFLPYYRSGYDEDGRVVYVVEYGKCNPHEFPQLSDEKVQEFWKYYEQFVRRVERDGALNNGAGAVLIADYDGFGLNHYASAPALKTALQMLARLVRVNHAMKYGFYVNVNYAGETFITMAKTFLGDFLNKIETYGTRSEKWKPILLRNIPASQLPPKYGGSESWKPLSLD